MQTFNQIFTNFSNLLFWPVCVFLSLLLLHSLYRIGNFISVYKKRKSDLVQWSNLIIKHREIGLSIEEWQKGLQHNTQLSLACMELSQSKLGSGDPDRIFHEVETKWESRLQMLRDYLRLGPMLGLMGTLIPMGPALVGLAGGDIASMAANMQIAFSTTVIGVFLGAVGYVLWHQEKKWMQHDLMALDYIICESITGQGKANHA